MPKPSRVAAALAAAATTLAMTACAGGGSGDSTSSSSDAAGAGSKTLSLYAFSVPKPGFDAVIPAFQKTDAGKGVTFQQSYGASGDQSRKVAAGAKADIVNFSVEPDITRLVDANLVAKDWNAGQYKGVAFGSVVTMVVRKGNPKGIKDWDDLLKPGIEVVTPNPFSSGSAKWNLLAPYADKSDGGKNPQAGLDYLNKLITEHVKIQPTSGREATEAFVQGSGDVLLSYENEAIFAEKKGDAIQHLIPAHTFKIENPIAVVSSSKNASTAKAFVDYLSTEPAQTLLAQTGFRVVDQTVAAKYTDKLPTPEKLWTIDELGGWKTVDGTLFKKETGSIAKIYEEATK